MERERKKKGLLQEKVTGGGGWGVNKGKDSCVKWKTFWAQKKYVVVFQDRIQRVKHSAVHVSRCLACCEAVVVGQLSEHMVHTARVI